MRKALFITAILLFATLAIQFQQSVQAEGNIVDIKVHVSGEPVLGIGGMSTYTGTLVDTKNRNWNYTIYVASETGANISGAEPSESAPATGNLTAVNKTFTFDVTAPLDPGDLIVYINISSLTGDHWYRTTETITVVRPVTISATVDNPSDMRVNNATVRFYVNGDLIDTQNIDQIAPAESTDVSAEWIMEKVPPGWHDTRIEIDLDNDMEPEWVIQDRFYVEGGGTLILYLTIFFGLIAMVAGIYYISKRKMR
jgi:hypothetical protein